MAPSKRRGLRGTAPSPTSVQRIDEQLDDETKISKKNKIGTDRRNSAEAV
jgi:hypothetical protein